MMRASVYIFDSYRDCLVVGRMIIFTLFVCMLPLCNPCGAVAVSAECPHPQSRGDGPCVGLAHFILAPVVLLCVCVCVLLLTFPLFTPRRLRLPHTPSTATPICNTRTSICLPPHNTIVTPHSHSAPISIRSTNTVHSTQHTYPVFVRPICRSAQSIRPS
jgi:hypothetical protein